MVPPDELRLHGLVYPAEHLGGQCILLSLVAPSRRRPPAGWRVLCASLKARVDQLLNTSPQGIEQRDNGEGRGHERDAILN